MLHMSSITGVIGNILVFEFMELILNNHFCDIAIAWVFLIVKKYTKIYNV